MFGDFQDVPASDRSEVNAQILAKLPDADPL